MVHVCASMCGACVSVHVCVGASCVCMCVGASMLMCVSVLVCYVCACVLGCVYVCGCLRWGVQVKAHLQPKSLLDADRLGWLEVHDHILLSLGGNGPLHDGQGKVFTQVLHAGYAPGGRQRCDVSEHDYFGFSSTGPQDIALAPWNSFPATQTLDSSSGNTHR